MVTLPKNQLGIPVLGFGLGTYYYKYGDNRVNEKLVDIIQKAVRLGFVHIDSAESYNTDLELGAALKALTDVDRSSLFITDKYNSGAPSNPAEISPDGTPYEHLVKALKRIGTPYVDLYLLHSPFITKENHGFTLEEAWKSVEQAHEAGLAKHIGVSNFAKEDLDRILKVAKIKPEVNQIEFNAFLQDQTPGIVEFAQEHGIQIEAYSPLGPITKADKSKPAAKAFDLVLDEIATLHHKTKDQVLLRWVIQRGIVAISTTAKTSRLEEWAGVFDFKLNEGEVNLITKLGKLYSPPLRQYWIPEYGHLDKE